MVFDLNYLKPKTRRELDSKLRKQYAEHYANVLPKLGYRKDQHNSVVFDQLCDYFARFYGAKKELCDYPEKGLFLFGEKGTGKTTAMQIMSGLFGVEILPVEDMTVSFTCGKEEAFWDLVNSFSGQHLIIDDICNEREAKMFGNRLPLPEFLKRREAMWKTRGILTCFTSNARSRAEITALYGDTITSRLLGSCNFLKLTGPDRRIS